MHPIIGCQRNPLLVGQYSRYPRSKEASTVRTLWRWCLGSYKWNIVSVGEIIEDVYTP